MKSPTEYCFSSKMKKPVTTSRTAARARGSRSTPTLSGAQWRRCVPRPQPSSRIGRPSSARPRAWADHLLRWLDAPGAFHCTFDDLVRKPGETLGVIAERFGLRLDLADPPIPPPVTGRYSAWAARLRGDLGSTNHYAHGERTPELVEQHRPHLVFLSNGEILPDVEFHLRST